jgi:hypothetical protein
VTDQLDDFFADYRAGMTPEIVPAGPGAVRATVRRRRRIAATALVATAVVLVAAPVAGYAALNRNTDPGPAPAVSNTPAPEQSTATPAPSPSASVTPPAAPDGRIARADLLKARVDLPEWARDAPCVERGARLTGVGDGDGDNLLRTVKYGDVDRDGAQETVAIISCVYGQTGQTQVVVFDRDTAGKVVTLGRVAVTDRISGYPKPEQIGWIADIEPLADGTVRVTVGDVQPCCGWEEEWTQKQTRTYTWQDGRFRQTGGPERFSPNPLFTDLTVSAPDVKLVINNDGNPYGTITVTVRNKGDLDATVNLSLTFAGFEAYRIGPGWAACADIDAPADRPSSSYDCTLDQPLDAGEERVLRFGIQGAATGAVDTEGTVTVVNRPNGGYLPDKAGDDNSSDFRIS